MVSKGNDKYAVLFMHTLHKSYKRRSVFFHLWPFVIAIFSLLPDNKHFFSIDFTLFLACKFIGFTKHKYSTAFIHIHTSFILFQKLYIGDNGLNFFFFSSHLIKLYWKFCQRQTFFCYWQIFQYKFNSCELKSTKFVKLWTGLQKQNGFDFFTYTKYKSIGLSLISLRFE